MNMLHFECTRTHARVKLECETELECRCVCALIATCKNIVDSEIDVFILIYTSVRLNQYTVLTLTCHSPHDARRMMIIADVHMFICVLACETHTHPRLEELRNQEQAGIPAPWKRRAYGWVVQSEASTWRRLV